MPLQGTRLARASHVNAGYLNIFVLTPHTTTRRSMPWCVPSLMLTLEETLSFAARLNTPAGTSPVGARRAGVCACV
jgi:hypothetical protein